VILFIDAPDPDNPAAAVGVARHILANHQDLHIVLTGRPVNFRTPKEINKSQMEPNQMVRQIWETYVMDHSEMLLQDSAARIRAYLSKCNVETNDIRIYNGGIAPCAPLSDTFHDWDFLFDRKDLITNDTSDLGEILSPHQYSQLVQTYSNLSPNEREHKIMSTLRSYQFCSLDDLRHEIYLSADVRIFLGGPATGLVALFRDESLIVKISKIVGMYGSTRPGRATLLMNQFNIACDIHAACKLLMERTFVNVAKYFITTETSKQNCFMISADDMEECGINPYVVQLHKLWESTHNGKIQPLFDLLPIMANLPQYKDHFAWSKMKTVSTSTHKGKILHFVSCNSNDLNVHFVSQKSFVTKEMFLQFLIKTWP
jgi:hypothetical protein